MKKSLIRITPNIITLSRIAVTFGLLNVEWFSFNFYVMYSYCGISDVIDGFLARELSTTSNFGALLDSIADILFFGVVLLIILKEIPLTNFTLVWMLLIAIIRVCTAICSKLTHKKIIYLHTYANKLSGVLIFLVLFFVNTSIFYLAMGIILLVTSLASIEELYIILTTRGLDRNCKGVLFK
jgi:CDP-diacylglycerol--glycerol-3-phosphate 3-phosphatidyltransferase